MKLKALFIVLLLTAMGAVAQTTRVLGEGTTIKVRTDTAVPS
jgi:cytochrome c556